MSKNQHFDTWNGELFATESIQMNRLTQETAPRIDILTHDKTSSLLAVSDLSSTLSMIILYNMNRK